MEPILWHVKYVICDGNEELENYIWNWWTFLVKKITYETTFHSSIKVNSTTMWENIIVDFIGDKVLGPTSPFRNVRSWKNPR